jgi:hypothetical protein
MNTSASFFSGNRRGSCLRSRQFDGFAGEGIADGAAVFEAFGGSFGDVQDEVDLDEFVVVQVDVFDGKFFESLQELEGLSFFRFGGGVEGDVDDDAKSHRAALVASAVDFDFGGAAEAFGDGFAEGNEGGAVESQRAGGELADRDAAGVVGGSIDLGWRIFGR